MTSDTAKAQPATDHSFQPDPWRAYYETLDAGSQALRTELGDRAVLDLSYGEDPRQLLDIYLPPAAERDGRVFVFFHGGGIEDGHPRHYGCLARPFLDRGVIVVMPGYRLLAPELVAERYRLQEEHDVLLHQLDDDAAPELKAAWRADADAAIAAAQDADAAIDWVVREIARFGGDPQRIFIGGHSAGAMLAMTTACREGSPANGLVSMSPGYWQRMGASILGGEDPVRLADTWTFPQVPPQVVITFSEQEPFFEGPIDAMPPVIQELIGDGARISRELAQALQQRDTRLAVAAMPTKGHWETPYALDDPDGAPGRAVFAMLDADA